MEPDTCDLLCLDLPKAERIRANAPDAEAALRLSELAKALADPTRLELATALREGGELCGCDLAWIVGKTHNLVSHHLRMMRGAGACTSRRDGKMVLYSLTPEGIRLLEGLVPAPAVAGT